MRWKSAAPRHELRAHLIGPWHIRVQGVDLQYTAVRQRLSRNDYRFGIVRFENKTVQPMCIIPEEQCGGDVQQVSGVSSGWLSKNDNRTCVVVLSIVCWRNSSTMLPYLA